MGSEANPSRFQWDWEISIQQLEAELAAERKRAEVAERKKDTLLAALQKIRTGTEDPFAHGVAFDVLELMKECQ